jgi:hypothetical protein
MESTMRTETLANPRPRPRARRLVAAVLAWTRTAVRRARIPYVDDLPAHIRRDVGLPPEVHRPTHAPPRVF